jgi:biopolymer transport protein ExbD
MAEINHDQGTSGKDKKKGPKQKKSSTHIDMTPMVDLAFLLLTFFMLTTTFSKPKTMEVNMPVKPDDTTNITKIPESRSITILIGEENKIVWYTGTGQENPTPMVTNLSANGIRKTLIEKNRVLYDSAIKLKERLNKNEIPKDEYKKMLSELMKQDIGAIVLIKAVENANYSSVVDILDEMAITHISRYAIVDITDPEIKMLVDIK